MRKSKFNFQTPGISRNESVLLTGNLDSSVSSELFIPLSDQLKNGILVSDSSRSDEEHNNVIETVQQF